MNSLVKSHEGCVAITLRCRASGIHGAVTANDRNDLSHTFPRHRDRTRARFSYEILANERNCKIVMFERIYAESH